MENEVLGVLLLVGVIVIFFGIMINFIEWVQNKKIKSKDEYPIKSKTVLRDFEGVPVCPKCGRTLKCIKNISWGELSWTEYNICRNELCDYKNRLVFHMEGDAGTAHVELEHN